MPELLLLLTVLMAAGLLVAWPLLGADAGHVPAQDPERERLLVRHRLAIEALRDVEADYRAGSLDGAGYATQRDEAEREAADSLAALEATPTNVPAAQPGRRDLRLPAAMGAAVVALLLVGFALPSPFGLAERDARLERIRQLTDAVAADPRNTDALSELTDLYLAGGTSNEVGKALASLLLLRDADPADADANRRLISLLVQLQQWDEAQAATTAYAQRVGADEPDVPFFRGLIARGTGDSDEAIRQFDRFLELAPDDPRAEMVSGLREQLAAGTEG